MANLRLTLRKKRPVSESDVSSRESATPRPVASPPAAPPTPQASPVVHLAASAAPIVGPPPDGFIHFNEEHLPPLPSEVFSMLNTILDELVANDNLLPSPLLPDLNILPGYDLVIKHPMDFSTMRSKLHAHQYRTLTHFKHDLSLIFRNCLRYVVPNTVFSNHAVQLADLSDRLLGIHLSSLSIPNSGMSIAQASVPQPVQPPSKPTPTPRTTPKPKHRTPRTAPQPSPPQPSPLPSRKRSAAVRASRAVSSLTNMEDDDPLQSPPPPKRKEVVQREVFPDLEDLKSEKRSLPFDDLLEDIISRLERADELAMFLQPVNQREVPSYYKIIKKPIDLRLMREKARRGEYQNFETLKSDFDLMIGNALKFNPPKSLFATCAKRMRDYGHQLFEIEMYRTSIRPLTYEEIQSRQLLSTEIKMVDWVMMLTSELQKLDRLGLFSQPVDLTLYPDYKKYVAQPMDISTIQRKAEGNEYLKLAEVRTDVLLIALNVFRYNAPESDVAKEARFFMYDGLDLWAKLSRHRNVLPPSQPSRKRLISQVAEEKPTPKRVRKGLAVSKSFKAESVPSASMRQLQMRLRNIVAAIEQMDETRVFYSAPANAKNPVTFDSIKSCIDDQKYKSLVDLKYDIDQMLSNAQNFSDQSSLFNVTAKSIAPNVQKLLITEAIKSGEYAKFPHVHGPSSNSFSCSTYPSSAKVKENPNEKGQKMSSPTSIPSAPATVVCKLDAVGGRSFFSRMIQRFNCDESAIYAGPFAHTFDSSFYDELPCSQLSEFDGTTDLIVNQLDSCSFDGTGDLISALTESTYAPTGVPMEEDLVLKQEDLATVSVTENDPIIEGLYRAEAGELVLGSVWSEFKERYGGNYESALGTLLLNILNNDGDLVSVFECRNLIIDMLLAK
ncbi:hypothetical protein GEMRC1_003058 [Eukaryota sp. GEM-RC1]